jgi:ELWxxDGT repeat protein
MAQKSVGHPGFKLWGFLVLAMVLFAGFPGQIHAAPPYLVTDLNPSGSSSPNLLTNVNGTLYFTIFSGPNSDRLFKSNGTAAGTTAFGPSLPIGQIPMTASNGKLFFFASDGTNGGSVQLWRSDGTDSGTVKLFDPASLSNTTLNTSTQMTDVNGTLFFVTSTSSYDATTFSTTTINQLWQTDGTVVGTTQVPISYNAALPGASSDPPGITNLTNVNGTLFFIVPASMSTPGGMPGSGTGLSLWTSSGGTAQSIYQAGPGNNLAVIPELANINGSLYFVVGSELWKSDGTSIGTTLVKNDFGSPANIQSLTNASGTLFFILNGTELWKSDGTGSGTTRVKAFTSGLGGTIVNVNGVLYFTADDGSGNGSELWSRIFFPGRTDQIFGT